MNTKRIAIIGGGFRGVGCLRVLVQQGYQVDLFEKNDDVGGVWHSSNNYQGLSIHTPAKLNQFFDFPYPPEVDLTERLESKKIFEYIKSFCKHFDLYSHIKFHTQVHKIQYNSKKNTSTLVLSTKDGPQYTSKEYDFIINTHGYCDKHIPDFKGAEKFTGSIIHSFDANEEYLKSAIAADKKITILGAGKTATDLVLAVKKLKYNLIWLYRKSYWFLRYNPLHESMKTGGNAIYKALMLTGFLISSKLPKVSCWLWRLTNIIDTFGEKHSDYKKFHVALIDDESFDILKDTNKKSGVVGEIDRFDEHGYFLKDGAYIETDVVICCTGSSGTRSLIDIDIDGKKLDIGKVFKGYRASVIPQVPNLIFTAYHHFTMGLCDGELQAKWIGNYIESNFDEKYVTEHAITYDYPFFTKLILFDSNEYFLPKFMDMQFDFIHNRELHLFEYVSFVYNFFFKTTAVGPLNIHNPLVKLDRVNAEADQVKAQV